MTFTGVKNIADHKCETYTAGTKRKLMTAISLLGNPSVLLLDEPTKGVDAVGRTRLLNIVKEAKAKGKSIIFTSHRYTLRYLCQN